MSGQLRIFKCCTLDDGTYTGSPFIHDPGWVGDGPWYVFFSDKADTSRFDLGFGTKEQALAFVAELTQALKDPEIEPWD